MFWCHCFGLCSQIPYVVTVELDSIFGVFFIFCCVLRWIILLFIALLPVADYGRSGNVLRDLLYRRCAAASLVARVIPPALPVRERLRELELWTPCRLRGSPKTKTRLALSFLRISQRFSEETASCTLEIASRSEKS